MIHEFNKLELEVNSQVAVPVIYEGVQLELGFRLDLLIEDEVIIEIKSVDVLHDVHKKQLLTYLRLSNKKTGFLVNFNSASLIDRKTLIRIVN